MASPIFSSFLIKKYVVQLRYSPSSSWKDQDAYRSLEDAKRALRAETSQRPDIEGRILNRLTGQVVTD